MGAVEEEGGEEEGGEEEGGEEEGGEEESGKEEKSGEEEESGEGERWVDWELHAELREKQLRAMLAALDEDGLIDPDDEVVIRWVLSRRPPHPLAEHRARAEKFSEWIELVLREPPDSELSPFNSPAIASEDGSLAMSMYADSDRDATQSQSQELAKLAPSPQTSAASAAGAPAAATSPPPSAAASSSNTGAASSSTRGAGAPAWKATEGAAAQGVVREAERLRGRRKDAEADELLETLKAGERAPISSPEATRQAKALEDALWANAGSLANAQKVAAKYRDRPGVRSLIDVLSSPDLELKGRCFDNFVDFLSNHFATKGTRHGTDQNLLNGLLTSVVDGKMVKDRLIDSVARLLGQNWHAVRDAIVRRLKMDDELREGRVDAAWTQVSRADRCDMYKLPGFYAFCHDDDFFKFSSRHSEPLRNHVDVGKYQVRACLPLHTRTRTHHSHALACTCTHAHSLAHTHAHTMRLAWAAPCSPP